MSDDTTTNHSSKDAPKRKSRNRSILDQTLKHARDVADMASDVTRDVVGVAGIAADAAFNAAVVVTTGAARSAMDAANFTTDATRKLGFVGWC